MKKNSKTNSTYNHILDGKFRFVLPILLIVFAIGFIAYGIHDGEITAVFNKAINLCRECVGIG